MMHQSKGIAKTKKVAYQDFRTLNKSGKKREIGAVGSGGDKY